MTAENPKSINNIKQVKVSIDFGVASSFKDACAASNISMAAVLSRFMADFSNTVTSSTLPPDYSTRRKRRAAIHSIVKQLNQIRECEERYRDNIPENLQGSITYDRADELVGLLEEVVELLSTV